MVNTAAETTFRCNQGRAEGGRDNNGCLKRERIQLNYSRKKMKQPQTEKTSIAYVQILGTGMDTQDTLPSIFLFFDNLRIIFNAGEGLQRFCTEHKIKLSKINYICFSRVCSETVGGLPGLLLTLAAIGEKYPVLKGPLDLSLLVSAMKSFIPHASIDAESFGSVPSSTESLPPQSLPEDLITVCEDKLVHIYAIVLEPSYGEDGIVMPSDKSVIYICELSETKGKFYKEKAEKLGLVAGPKFGKLQRGIPVKSDCQDRMVHPSDVMDPPVPGPIVFIVDCPTERHAERLFITQSLNCYYSDFLGEAPPGKKTVNCIIHLTPASVVNIPEYQKWMKKFGSAQHIMAGHSKTNIQTPILRSSSRITSRLSYLCPQLFPTPASCKSLQHQKNAEVGFLTSSEEPSFCEHILAENLLKFTLHPHADLGLDKSAVPGQLVSSQVIDDLLSEIPEIKEAAQHIDQFWYKPGGKDVDMSGTQDIKGMTGAPSLDYDSLPCCLEGIRRDDAEFVLLGTGSSQPSKYRNVSSIYVNLFSKGGLLLDCGEGTLAQLIRRYGRDAAASAVRNLRCIWISHIHADHHAGLARILTLRRDLLKGIPHEPLHVVGPLQLATFLDRYNDLEDLNMQFLDCRSTAAASWDAVECDALVTQCQTSASESTKTEHMKNGSEEDANSSSVVQVCCSRSCSRGQKPSILADSDVDFSLLKSFKEVLREAGLERLTSFPVVHCPAAYGVILEARERVNSVGALIPGWKVVYSGDTRPCMEVIKASRGATLLIHEATFEDSLSHEAVARNHSTTSEAIEVGDTAGAYRVILTHFSQRYPKIPSFDDINSRKTCIAFDLMSINMADLPILPRVLPYLKLLFKNDATEILENDSYT